MYNLRKTKSRDASMRSRSKSNSSMNVDNQNTKNYRKNAKEDQISEHESEYQCSQSSLKKDIEEEKKLQLSDDHLLNQYQVTVIFMEKEMKVILMLILIKILIESKK